MDIRSRKTRQTIAKCFPELLRKTPVSKITVTEICAMTKINRDTYYKHYLDIRDLQESLEQRDLARRLSARLSRLPARERQVLALRYGLGGAAPHTQLQVAQKLGLSRSYISRLESRGLSLLKKL